MTVECQTSDVSVRHCGRIAAGFPKRARTSVMPQQRILDLTLNQNGYEVVPKARSCAASSYSTNRQQPESAAKSSRSTQESDHVQ